MYVHCVSTFLEGAHAPKVVCVHFAYQHLQATKGSPEHLIFLIVHTINCKQLLAAACLQEAEH